MFVLLLFNGKFDVDTGFVQKIFHLTSTSSFKMYQILFYSINFISKVVFKNIIDYKGQGLIGL